MPILAELAWISPVYACEELWFWNLQCQKIVICNSDSDLPARSLLIAASCTNMVSSNDGMKPKTQGAVLQTDHVQAAP